MTSQIKGIVAAGHQETAKAAAEILSEGGNAYDAILAGLVAACIPEVVLASVGGGGFLMAKTADNNSPVLYDFFAQTPYSKRPVDELDFFEIQADFGPATQKFQIGAGSTAVPGFLHGVFTVHQDLGTLPISRILAPAINLARKGVRLSSFQAYLFTVVEPILTASDAAKSYFCPANRLLRENDIYKNSDLANTLEQVSKEGLEFLCYGDLGHEIVSQSQRIGGHLTIEDLKNYKVIKRKPFLRRYHDHTIALNPAPAASGPLIGFGLELLSNYLETVDSPSAVDLAQTMFETNLFRARNDITIDAVTEPELQSHLKNMKKHRPSFRGTTHISVIDSEGNAASATVSNGEGNGLMVGGFGFMLNNMLGEEDINPEGFHNWQHNTRLSSMMAPTLIINEKTDRLVALGSGGSNRIRTAVLQVISNIVDRNMNIEDAVNAPRMHLERGGKLSYEAQFDDETQRQFQSVFDSTEIWPEPNLFFGGVHSVQRYGDGTMEGAGDPRRSGVVIKV